MADIKSAREIAMEKSRKIEKLSPEEMAEIKQENKIENILAKYYKDQIETDDLWYHLKGLTDRNLLKAQNNFLQSVTFYSNKFDIEKRKNGILAIENLRESSRSSDIEHYLNQLKKIQDDFQTNKEQFMQRLKNELEKDPQKRMQTFQQDNQIMVKQLSLEEALEQNKELKQHMKQLENHHKKQFDMVKNELNKILND